ncbi:MAG TPA: biotin transporter BioY [Gemmatimonadaceae bacterium]|nr:biotin transporter BioY [Gemmatimonadaceae bacterium]
MTTLTIRRDRAAWIPWVGAVGFALALAAAAQVAIPLPGTPVPFTLGPLLVVLAGMMLGPAAGAAGMVLYLLAGVAGLPVFAPGGAPGAARLLGPTGGYLVAYPAAAYVVGLLARRAPGFAARALAAMTGILVIYLGGLAQLAILTGSLQRAAVLGVLPFVSADAVKALVAAAITGSRGARRRA